MITDADVKKIEKAFEKRFSTFVTRDDAKSFATKDDLKRFATKDDLKNYATKDDLINFKDSILSEIIKLREDIEVVIGYRDLIEDHGNRIEKLETIVYQ
ncbi:MAG: hypothetical protein WC744_00885 [Patescibacteria group bacterium]|jgi:hypothetical protein